MIFFPFCFLQGALKDLLLLLLLITVFWLCHHTKFRKSGDLSFSNQVKLCKSLSLVRVTAAI